MTPNPQLDLLAPPREAPPNGPPLHRRQGPATSKAAAARVKPTLSAKQVAEEWRPIFGGYYEVSNHGRVRRVVPGRGRCVAGRLLNPWLNLGYPQVSICVEKVRRVVNVHILVAQAFLGPRPPGMEVNHIDADKTNAAVWNLEYVTRTENVRHAAMLGLSTRGETHYNARFTSAQVEEIRQRHREGERVNALARAHGVSHGTISLMLSGKTWKPAPTEYREATPAETRSLREEAGCA